MSNYTTRDKLDTSLLILKGMEDRKQDGIDSGLSRSWLSKQIDIQLSIATDYRNKFEAEKLHRAKFEAVRLQ